MFVAADLTGVKPDGNPVILRVNVTAFDPRVDILETRPRTIQVVLDQKISKPVQVAVVTSDPPAGITIGEIKVDPKVAWAIPELVREIKIEDMHIPITNKR